LDSINFQNLPSRDKAKKALKNAVVAPDGHVVINCDSSQIEARVLAWLAGQNDVTEAFADKRDVYCEFATKVYKRKITKADPTERFVGKTCILGLGYGTGAQKLQHTLKTSPPGADLALQECQDIVNLYRASNDKITGLWRECDLALKQMMDSASRGGALGNGAITYDSKGIRLPNGLYIRYPNLRLNEEGKMVYDSRKGTVNIWGGAMVENIVQALARIVVGKQMLWVAEHYRPVLTVHDAVVCIVPENEVKDALEYIMLCMSTPPSWAKGLPVACEAKYGKSYGDC
jgi:DNA polymerase